MPPSGMRILVASLAAALVLSVSNPTLAQNTEQKSGDKQQAGDGKEIQKKLDDFAEAEKVLGGPAANPECLWLGRRVVSLLWRDDLDTAFRHLDLYDRFGCPGPHIQASFRCVVRQGSFSQPRVHACWINPELPPATAAAQPAAGTPGTSNQ